MVKHILNGDDSRYALHVLLKVLLGAHAEDGEVSGGLRLRLAESSLLGFLSRMWLGRRV